jgi:hypothetical protein
LKDNLSNIPASNPLFKYVPLHNMERYLQLKASPFKAGDGFNSFQMFVFGGALLLLAVRGC